LGSFGNPGVWRGGRSGGYGAAESLLGLGLVAGEQGEGSGVAGVVAKQVGETRVVGDFPVVLVDCFAEVELGEVEEAGLDAAEALETPGGHNHLLDEGFERAATR